MLQTHHCWLTGSHWSKKRGKVETNQLNWTYNSQDIIVFFIFCINCTVDLIVRVWICTTRKNPQISGPYSTKEEHCVTVCFYLQLKRSPYLRPITKRITTPFSSSLRNWSPTNVQYFRYEKMKGKKKAPQYKMAGERHLPCGIHVCLIESLRFRFANVVKTPITKDILCRAVPWSPSESPGDKPWLIAWAALAAARRISMSDIVLSNALRLKHQDAIL